MVMVMVSSMKVLAVVILNCFVLGMYNKWTLLLRVYWKCTASITFVLQTCRQSSCLISICQIFHSTYGTHVVLLRVTFTGHRHGNAGGECRNTEGMI